MSSRSTCLLLHLLPCQPCPAAPGSQRHHCSLGTVCIPYVQGASAPFEAEIYCSEGGLWYNQWWITRDTAWRGTCLGILFSAWGIVEGKRWVRGCFPKHALFDHKVRSKGIFSSHILFSDSGKSARQKRQHFFSVIVIWKQSSLLYFHSSFLWAKQISLVLGEEEVPPWFKASYSWLIPGLIFPRNRARELNPTSAVGTLACSPFICGAGAAATEGRTLIVSRRYWAVRGGKKGFEGNGNLWGQGPVIWGGGSFGQGRWGDEYRGRWVAGFGQEVLLHAWLPQGCHVICFHPCGLHVVMLLKVLLQLKLWFPQVCCLGSFRHQKPASKIPLVAETCLSLLLSSMSLANESCASSFQYNLMWQ